MRIRWTVAAAADLDHINDYLQEHYPQYREPTMRKLYEAIRALKDTPYRGRPGRVEGTRDSVSAYALRRGIQSAGAEHRNAAHLSHRPRPLKRTSM